MDKPRCCTTAFVVVVAVLVVPWAASACGDTSERTCRDCIIAQMKYGCPLCMAPVRCMARCLWRGTSRGKCSKRCDCHDGEKPRLSDCRSCLLKCKCDCLP
ncbi:hypothetical protein MLD38_036797 [Melastoma candidum]|uniref:Uncharacterized protein n=1 Tax=Melastoma candidum TaxID=119954 RepID=A0ACB9LLS7_9MYRT|nr:hypothetical protein MLD38_036797 [Melastoma candidum]